MSEPTALFVTSSINDRIDDAKLRHNLAAKEGLVHALLMLAMTDERFVARAAEMSRYLGDVGATRLEARGL